MLEAVQELTNVPIAIIVQCSAVSILQAFHSVEIKEIFLLHFSAKIPWNQHY